MFKKLVGVLVTASLVSCQSSPKIIVDSSSVDSLLSHYSPDPSVDNNLLFWQKRMDTLPDDFVNGPEYAAALIAAFRQHGNIQNLLKADSLIRQNNKANQGKEPAIWRSLAGLALMQHQFSVPDSFLKRALAIEGRTFPNSFLDFDIVFERGQYRRAKNLLASLKGGNEYGYLFRRSKYEHYNGSLDSAIACMSRAAEKAGTNNYLKQAALSNTADLYLHLGDIQKAYEFYLRSIQLVPSDLHSLTGIGWIALVHDKNDSLAEQIFTFVHSHSEAPEVLLKLSQLEGYRGNTQKQKDYAIEFASVAGNSAYGKMYNKYLIDLYTGILNQPSKAVELSLQDLDERPTPQVYAWYAWSLFCNKENDKAWSIYKGFVSGQPLEGPELYYMGKMMQGMNKAYNAHQFFKTAWKNRYDLDPVKQRDLENNLEK